MDKAELTLRTHFDLLLARLQEAGEEAGELAVGCLLLLLLLLLGTLAVVHVVVVHVAEEGARSLAVQVLDARLGHQLQVVCRVDAALVVANRFVLVRPPAPQPTPTSAHTHTQNESN